MVLCVGVVKFICCGTCIIVLLVLQDFLLESTSDYLRFLEWLVSRAVGIPDEYAERNDGPREI